MIQRVIALSLLFGLMSLSTGCAKDYAINISHSNLADSYIDPYRIVVNDKSGVPASLIGCSNGIGTSNIAILRMKSPPQYITVEWLHILSNQYYRAKIMLAPETSTWLQDPPFNRAKKRTMGLIVQWRGVNQVVAMLVADFTDFTQGKMDLGEAFGQVITEPKNSPNYSVSYETLQEKPGDAFLPGHVRNYDRTLDSTLSRVQRFGCPRRKDGSVDKKQLPPAKLPFVYGEKGEHIACANYACSDKQQLIEQLRSLERKRYPQGSTPAPMVFNSSPTPKPAW